MENSRRLLDRSRELGLKKPRLEEQKIIGRNSNARAFVQSPAEAASMRGRDSEGSDTTSRLGAIQELVSQYRTALAELTFNSKPIITNLTIIAGENLNAAKPIAAVICSNIIEVPTEQKLPSLYLLDSIVKNIGRDYIKYFAARLPEVFCKAYRQVDPAVHPGMRHLFGTWKNVFPPQSLQMIEKELGFPTAVSGSALGTATSKAVSQSQRPAQSIHVNPRYLEARERQQSSTVKGTINDMNGSLANSPDDTEKLERTTNVYSERRRADPRLKMHNIQHPPKNAGIELVQQKNSEFGTRDFSTELAKQSVLGIGKASDRVTEQRIDRAWYGSGSTLTGTTSNQSYGFDINLRQTNHLASRSATDDVHLQHSENLSGRSSIGMDRSWKNSEEEEYTWDDVNSRSTSYGVNRKSKRDPRFMDDSERLDSQSPHLQPQMLREIGSSVDREASGASLLFEQRNQTAFEKLAPLTEARATLGIGFSASDRTIPGHSDGHTTSLNGLSTNANSMIRTSLKGSSSINSSFQQSIHIPSLHKYQSDPIQYDPSAPSHKPVLSQISTLKKSSKSSSGNISHPGSEIPGQMSTSCLLTAVMESGILGKNSDIGSIPKLSCQTAISLPSQTSSRPAQPSDPPPTQLESKVASATLVSSLLHESTSVSLAQKETEQPPLPRKPPRSSIIGSASEETTTATSNPVSNLLNSLVSRGLISAAKTESSVSIPLKNICDPHSQVQGTATASLMNSTRQVSSDISPSSTSKQLSLLKPTTEAPVATHVSSVNEIKSHIGFEFKPEVIRVPHPVVISELLSDLPHRCGICGLRVRLKERFERHMEWHTLKKSDSDSSSKASRRWYVNSLDWVGEKVSTHKTSDVLEVSNKELENGDEQMVPADENHCVCVLCGELFEDLYNLKTDQWMFRGAVYLTLSTHSKITSTAVAQGPVVHASCISESSVRELGLANNVKVDEDA